MGSAREKIEQVLGLDYAVIALGQEATCVPIYVSKSRIAESFPHGSAAHFIE